MKKLFTAAILSVCLFSFGATQANAQVCVSLDNFCDQLELQVDPNGNVYGLWDWTCDGVTLQPVIGLFDPPNVTAGTYIATLGMAIYFVFDISSGTFDLWGYDGVNPPSAFQIGQPYSFSVGSCTFAAGVPGDQPSLLGDYTDGDYAETVTLRKPPAGVK